MCGYHQWLVAAQEHDKSWTCIVVRPVQTCILQLVTAIALPIVLRALATQRNYFAVQLYISSYADYLEICHFLGLSAQYLSKSAEIQGSQVDANSFKLRSEQGRKGGGSGVMRCPANSWLSYSEWTEESNFVIGDLYLCRPQSPLELPNGQGNQALAELDRDLCYSW